MNGLLPLISKPLSALLGVLVGMLLIGLVVFGVDVERSLVVLVEEFSAEALAKESTNIILIHALEIHPIVSLSFIVFSMLTGALTPKGAKHMETVFFIPCELEMFRPIHALNEVHKTVEGHDIFFHVVHHGPVLGRVFIG